MRRAASLFVHLRLGHGNVLPYGVPNTERSVAWTDEGASHPIESANQVAFQTTDEEPDEGSFKESYAKPDEGA